MHDEAPHAAQQQRYRFKFVVFDWHGTIEADPKASRDRVRHLFASDDEAVRFRTCYKQHKREHVRLVKESEGALEYDKMAVVRHTFDVIGKEYSAEIAAAYTERTLAPGAIELLQELQGAGVPMGLIRNSSLPASAFQSKTLDAMGVTAYFHVDRNVVLSGIVGAEKPERRIFEALLAKCNMQQAHEHDPRSVIFIGNETQVDVVGGAAMGWTTVLLRGSESSSNGLADHECDSFEQLAVLLRSSE